MSLNFSQAPYMDDFDPEKNFHRILFKPGVAVQARELTQSQTILQDQISKFASSIYSQNTPISGGKITTNFNCDYIKLKKSYNGVDIVASNFLNKDIVDSSGTISARVIATSEATMNGSIAGDPPTLIVSYISGGTKFADSMDIFTLDGYNYSASTLAGTSGGTTSVGKSSVVSISHGVYYVVNGHNTSNIPNADGSIQTYTIGNFVTVPQQTVTISKYDTKPTARVGLSINEVVYDYIDDTSLLDPAVGASNYQAPGADRYVIKLDLVTLPLIGNEDNFIELARIKNGVIIKQTDTTVYSTIDDYFAKRTYDTNGDYIVNPFKLTPSTGSTVNTYNLGVSKGIAYVQGYRLENQSPITLSSNRARTYTTPKDLNLTTEYGSYLYVTNVNGSTSGIFQVNKMPSVDLHCVSTANVNSTNANTYNSTVVGTARLRNLDYISGASSPNTYIFKAYISDVATKVLTSNSSNATINTIQFYDTSSKFSTANGAYVGLSISIVSGNSASDIRTISLYDGTTKTATVSANFSVAPVGSTFSLNFKVSDVDSVIQANTSYAKTSYADVDLVNGKLGSSTVLYEPNIQELIYNVGSSYTKMLGVSSITEFLSTTTFQSVSFTGSGSTKSVVVSIPPSDTNYLTFRGNGTLSPDSIKAYYTVVNRTNGAIVNFTTANSSVVVASDQKSITFSSSDISAITADIIAKVSVQYPANSPTNHILKSKTLVTSSNTVAVSNTTSGVVNVDGNTFVHQAYSQVYIKNAGIASNGTKQSLYISDVKRVSKVIDTKGVNVSPTLAMLSDSSYDVTAQYSFDNGQRDSFYDHASITLKSGSSLPKGNLLILLDYYSHGTDGLTSSGDGYFSVNSYQSSEYVDIPSYTATNGKLYSLRDCIDFRAVRINANSTFNFKFSDSTSGMYLPDNLSIFNSDYSYYLGRNDLLVLSKDRSFQIITGTPSSAPTFPSQPTGSLLIAKMSLEPYTAYIQGEVVGRPPSLSIEMIQHKRWSMQDISNLQSRINNLEYYTALNTLEQSASSAQITDVYGLNRFKNGILVDDFSSFSTAFDASKDWSASIDILSKKLTAKQYVENFPLTNEIVDNAAGNFTGTTNYTVHNLGSTQYYSLPYSSIKMISQSLASNTISLNPFATHVVQGLVFLSPSMDNWIDNTQLPDQLVVDPTMQIWQASDTTNVLSSGNYKAVVGTSLATSQSSTQATTSGWTWYNGSWSHGFIETDVTSTTTTSSYGATGQQQILGNYSAVDNTFAMDGNVIRDIRQIPYIRPQEILVEAKGLTRNAPVVVTFDGTNVNQYIRNLDTIKLTNVSGNFAKGQAIGIKISSVFTPIATVCSVSYSGSNVTLQIAGNYHSSYYDSAIPTPTVYAYTADSTGNWTTQVASGTATHAGIVVNQVSGRISAVGGSGWTDYAANPIQYFVVKPLDFGTLATDYGIWGSADQSGDLGYGKFNFTTTSANTHYLLYSVRSNSDKQGFIKINGVDIGTYPAAPYNVYSSANNFNSLYNNVVQIPVISGSNTIEFYMKDTGTQKNGSFAFKISDSSWTHATNNKSEIPTTSGNVLISSRSLGSSSIPSSAGTLIELPGKSIGNGTGGRYFIGATKISLGGLSSTVDGYYNGCQIGISATRTRVDAYNNTLEPTNNYFYTTIVSYDGLTHTATLSDAVEVSLGYSSLNSSDITSQYSISGTNDSATLAEQAGGVAKLSTNNDGTFVAIFNIPQGIFKTGERVLRIDNRTTPNDAGSATTFAEGVFTASGLATISQNMDFGTSVSGASHTFTQTNYLNNQLISTATETNITKYYAPWDPIAQTFQVDGSQYKNGVFLESVDIFFQSSSTNSSDTVALHVVPTINGYPGGETLAHSSVVIHDNDINVSSNPHYLDSSTLTKFKFPVPVFIRPDVLYAFVLKSSSVDCNIYLASQNQNALSSTAKTNPTDATPSTITKIGQIPGIGGLFESQNGTTWTADQSKTLMMNINICAFDTTKTPVIPFRATTTKKVNFSDAILKTYYPSIQTLNSYPTDLVFDTFNVTTTDSAPLNTSIDYNYSAVLNSGRVPTDFRHITPGQLGYPTFDDIYFDDSLGERVLVNGANNSFILNATMSSTSNSISPMISTDGLSLFTTQWKINNLGLTQNQININKSGAGYGISDASATISSPDIAGGIQATASVIVTANTISSVHITNAGSGYLNTPTITISGANTTPAVVTMLSEFSPTGGNALCKYLTKKVTLASGNDSQDLRVFYSAYRPVGTNIYVFYKLRANGDPSNFDDNGWKLMTNIGTNMNVTSLSRTDVYEFESAPGTNNQADNIISYVGADGVTRNSFIDFSIKVVMTTNDNTKVPYLTNIRAVALPSGTGA